MGTLPKELRARLPDLVESPPPSPRPKTSRRRNLAETTSFARLDEFRDEARAGAPDTWLVQKTGVSLGAVHRWRRHNTILRPRGRKRQEEVLSWALDAFGDGYDAELHAVNSRVRGLWELPEFVLHKPLDYDALCRLVWELHNTCGHSAELISQAFGIREKDITMALELQAAHLDSTGTECPRCGRLMDTTGGELCSKTCR